MSSVLISRKKVRSKKQQSGMILLTFFKEKTIFIAIFYFLIHIWAIWILNINNIILTEKSIFIRIIESFFTYFVQRCSAHLGGGDFKIHHSLSHRLHRTNLMSLGIRDGSLWCFKIQIQIQDFVWFEVWKTNQRTGLSLLIINKTAKNGAPGMWSQITKRIDVRDWKKNL